MRAASYQPLRFPVPSSQLPVPYLVANLERVFDWVLDTGDRKQNVLAVGGWELEARVP